MVAYCVIFAAGEYNCEKIYVPENGFIIAADGGLDFLNKIKVKPDLIIGDFDSLESEPVGENIIKFPVRKDDTDSLLAIKKGFELGFKNFILYGFLGGSLDHTIANLQCLSFIADNGGIGYAVGKNETVTAIKNSKLTFNEKGRFSVFALGNEAKTVSITGAEYEVKSIYLTPSFPIGVGNRFKGDKSTIGVDDGTIHIIWEQKNKEKFPIKKERI